jgi:hypothetical protein
MRGCTGCWDDLCWDPVDFWIQILCQRVGRLHGERELISGTQSSSGTLRGLNRHELTQMDAQESVNLLGACLQFIDQCRGSSRCFQCSGSSGFLFRGSKAYGTRTTDELETDSGGGTKSTSLAKREC